MLGNGTVFFCKIIELPAVKTGHPGLGSHPEKTGCFIPLHALDTIRRHPIIGGKMLNLKPRIVLGKGH